MMMTMMLLRDEMMIMVMTELLMVENLMKTQTNDFLITRPFTLHCRRTLKGLIAPEFF